MSQAMKDGLQPGGGGGATSDEDDSLLGDEEGAAMFAEQNSGGSGGGFGFGFGSGNEDGPGVSNSNSKIVESNQATGYRLAGYLFFYITIFSKCPPPQPAGSSIQGGRELTGAARVILHSYYAQALVTSRGRRLTLRLSLDRYAITLTAAVAFLSIGMW